MSRRCAYLTMDDIGNFVIDSDLSFAPMADLGWEVEMVPWRRAVDWDDYDVVYICTPWDYQSDVAAFLDVLEAVERSSAQLVNSLELVRWNLEKTYLGELEMRGTDIVPSLFFDRFDADRVAECFAAHDAGKIFNPTLFEGKLEGSIHMGLGYAISEELVMEDGRPKSTMLRKMGILRAK